MEGDGLAVEGLFYVLVERWCAHDMKAQLTK
jgi:hypothetical protein